MCHEVMNQTDTTTESKENHPFSSTKQRNQLIINKFIFVCRQKNIRGYPRKKTNWKKDTITRIL